MPVAHSIKETATREAVLKKQLLKALNPAADAASSSQLPVFNSDIHVESSDDKHCVLVFIKANQAEALTEKLTADLRYNSSLSAQQQRVQHIQFQTIWDVLMAKASDAEKRVALSIPLSLRLSAKSLAIDFTSPLLANTFERICRAPTAITSLIEPVSIYFVAGVCYIDLRAFADNHRSAPSPIYRFDYSGFQQISIVNQPVNENPGAAVFLWNTEQHAFIIESDTTPYLENAISIAPPAPNVAQQLTDITTVVKKAGQSELRRLSFMAAKKSKDDKGRAIDCDLLNISSRNSNLSNFLSNNRQDNRLRILPAAEGAKTICIACDIEDIHSLYATLQTAASEQILSPRIPRFTYKDLIKSSVPHANDSDLELLFKMLTPENDDPSPNVDRLKLNFASKAMRAFYQALLGIHSVSLSAINHLVAGPVVEITEEDCYLNYPKLAVLAKHPVYLLSDDLWGSEQQWVIIDTSKITQLQPAFTLTGDEDDEVVLFQMEQ